MISLSNKLLQKTNEARFLKAQEERHISYSDAIEKGYHIASILSLYPTDDLKKVGLSRYRFKTFGNDVVTTIANSKELLVTNLPLIEKNENHQLMIGNGPRNRLPINMIAEIVADMTQRELRIWDQPTYCVRTIRIDQGRLNIAFYLESFLVYRHSMGALWDELLYALSRCGNSPRRLISKKSKLLRYRQSLLPTAQSVSDYANRTCASGIHSTVAIWRDDYQDYVIPLQKRSKALSEGQELLVTLPEAFHQPMIDSKSELNLRSTFFREMFEEMFGGEESIEKVQRLKYDWYMYESEPMKWLLQNPESHDLFLTGCGINFVSGNYEFSLLCRIRKGEFWKLFGHKLKLNWESESTFTPLVSLKDHQLVADTLLRNDWSSPSLYCFARALSVLRSLGDLKVPDDFLLESFE